MTLSLSCGLALAAGAIPAMAEIRVGVAAPLAGRFEAEGAAVRTAVEAAVVAANTTGGLAGQRLQVVAADDGCNTKAGAEAARTLVAAGVAVVIGHACGSAALAGAPVYAQAGTPLLSLTRAPELTDRRAGPNIFRVAGRDDRQGEAIAAHIVKVLAGRRVALVHDRTRYGQALVAGVQRGLAAANVVPVLFETITAGEKDYAMLAARFGGANAEVLVYGGFGAEASVLRQSIWALGHDPVMIGGDALAAESGNRLDGVRFLRPRHGSRAEPTGDRPEGLAELASLAFAVWSRATIAAGTPEPAAVVRQWAATPRNAATATPQRGAAASVNPDRLFSEMGDAGLASFRVHVVRDGKEQPAE